jgi:Tfp pilus assembly protein PilF/lysophospholipase L1-like esterase
MLHTHPKTSLLQKVILVAFGLAVSILLLEIGLRIVGFMFLYLQESRNRDSIGQKGAYRILCLGESTTALGGRNSYPFQLEEILNQRNIGIKFSVINLGVVGTNTKFITEQLEANLNKYKPNMVTTMMGINDYETYIFYMKPSVSKAMLFLGSLRTYKLARLLWLNILAKAQEAGFYKPVKERFTSPSKDSFNKAIELNPKNDRAYTKLGKRYLYQGEFTAAEESFKRAIELNPKNNRAYTQLGWAYYNQQKLTAAEESFKRAIELNPKNYQAHVGLGRCYILKKDLFSAEESFKRAIELNPKNGLAYAGLVRCYIYLGWRYYHQGEFTAAEESFKRAIELNPGEDKAYCGLAAFYKERGNYESAKEYYNKAIMLRLDRYNPITGQNYQKVKEILDKRGIKLVCVEYPVRSIAPLKKLFEGKRGVIFVDNEKIFKDAIIRSSYKEYFIDHFGGDFGHCTYKGHRLLAENIANTILKEVFHKMALPPQSN